MALSGRLGHQITDAPATSVCKPNCKPTARHSAASDITSQHPIAPESSRPPFSMHLCAGTRLIDIWAPTDGSETIRAAADEPPEPAFFLVPELAPHSAGRHGTARYHPVGRGKGNRRTPAQRDWARRHVTTAFGLANRRLQPLGHVSHHEGLLIRCGAVNNAPSPEPRGSERSFVTIQIAAPARQNGLYVGGYRGGGAPSGKGPRLEPAGAQSK